MTDVWFKPTKSAAHCHYRVALPDFAPAYVSWRVQIVVSTCGIWRTKVTVNEAIEFGVNALAPDFEICAKCAALLKIKPKPQAPVIPHFSLLSDLDRIPIEEMPDTETHEVEDPPDELAGVDLNDL